MLGRSGQYDRGSRYRKVGTVVFSHTIHVEPDLIGQGDFFNEVAHSLGSAYHPAGARIGRGFTECVNADFHELPL
jgi:hypothetical protein